MYDQRKMLVETFGSKKKKSEVRRIFLGILMLTSVRRFGRRR